jgi:Toastrack DUF4097
VSGCGPLHARFEDSRTEEAAIDEVRIEGSSGAVLLERSGTVTQIDHTVSYTHEKPTARFDRVAGGVLNLNTNCAQRECSISYRVRLPGAVKVTGHLDSGRIDVKDVTAATLSTNSGQISITNASGDVNAHSDSGRINATDARTGSGSMSIGLSNAQDVKAQTDSGRISLVVPGGASYRVRYSTDSGRANISIPNDPSGRYQLDLSTQSGSISVIEGPAPESPRPSSS